jgi:hypothetical protein
MTTIYPVQAALIRAGISNVASLVLAGRVVMAVLSSAGLVVIYLCASRLYGRTLALVATMILATESLQIAFGGLELPRTLSAVFVVLAFFFLRSERTRMAALSGVCLAVAACLRFSEVVFMLPALTSPTIERRWRTVVVLMAAWMVAAGALQAASDMWYWGEAFHSAHAAFRFTVVDRLSSRGYEPPWAYLTALNGWTDVVVFTLAVVGTRRATWQLAFWCWLPIVGLSALPHKEPRYLIPVLPFVALLAAFGLRNVWRFIRAAPTAPSSQRLAAALLVALPLRCVAQAASYHVNRSDAQVALASVLDARPEAEAIAVEQAWKFGGHLYFRLHRVVDDLSAEDLASAASLTAATRRHAIRAVAISATSCEGTRCDELLLSAGFRENVNRIAKDAGYRVFERP